MIFVKYGSLRSFIVTNCDRIVTERANYLINSTDLDLSASETSTVDALAASIS